MLFSFNAKCSNLPFLIYLNSHVHLGCTVVKLQPPQTISYKFMIFDSIGVSRICMAVGDLLWKYMYIAMQHSHYRLLVGQERSDQLHISSLLNESRMAVSHLTFWILSKRGLTNEDLRYLFLPLITKVHIRIWSKRSTIDQFCIF